MNISIQQAGLFFLAAGALHGTYLMAVSWMRQDPVYRSRTIANRFLGLYFGSFTFYLLNAALFFTGWLERVPFLLGTPMPLLYLIGPALWFYVQFSLYPGRGGLRMQDYWHFLPALVCLILASPYYFSDPAAKAAYLAQLPLQPVELPAKRAFYFGGHLLQTAGYLIVLSPKVRRMRTAFRQTPLAQWIRRLFWLLTGLLAIYFATFFSFILFESIRAEIRFGFDVALAVFLHFNFWLVLRESALLNGDTIGRDAGSNSRISSRRAARLRGDIQKLMEMEKPYLDPDFTLSDLANRLDSNTYYVSQAINQKLGRTFPDFVNTFRVETAQRLLLESDLKILAIALESGFNNKNTFNRVFKKQTGMTPSAYRERQGYNRVTI